MLSLGVDTGDFGELGALDLASVFDLTAEHMELTAGGRLDRGNRFESLC